MILHRLELHHVKGVDHFTLELDGEQGVTVIHGPNEQGKSTLLEAIGTVLSVKYNSKAAAVKALATKGSTEGSRIVLEATIGGERVTIDKTFNAKAQAKLVTPQGTLTAGDAEEALRTLLEEHHDSDLQKIAFVEQGSVETALQALGLPALQRSLGAQGQDAQSAQDAGEAADAGAAALGVVADGSEDALIARVQQEAERYYTLAKRKPTKELLAAQQAQQAAAEQVAELQERYTEHQRDVDEVEQARARQEHARAQLQDLHARVESTRQEAEAAKQTRAQLEEAAATRAAVRERLQRAEELLGQRKDLLSEQQRTAEALSAAEAAVAELSERAAAHEESVVAQRRRVDELEAATTSARDQAKRASAAVELVTAHGAAVAARRAAERAEQAAAAVDAASRACGAHRVTDADVRAVEELDVAARTQRAVLEATSTSLRVRARAATTVAIGGEEHALAAEDTHTQVVTEETTLVIGDVDVTITPGQSEAQAAKDYERAASALQEALADLQAESLAELRDMAAASKEAQAVLDRAEDHLRQAIGSSSVDALRRAAVEQDSAVAARAEALGLEDLLKELTPPAIDADAAGEDEAGEETETAAAEANAQFDALLAQRQQEFADTAAAAEQAFEEARAAESSARKDLDVLLSSPLRQDTAKAEATAESAADAARRAASAVEAFEAQHPAQALEDSHVESQAQMAAAITAYENAEKAVAQADPELAEDKARGAATALHGAQDTIAQAEDDLRTRTARIDSAQGVAESYNRACAALEDAERRLAAVQRRADAAWVLLETLLRFRDEARAQYAQPYTQLLDSLMTQVFRAESTTALDDNLDIAGRLQGGETVDFAQLSGGAREQIAILQRLAISQLIAAEERVPLILDDALGNTDTERLQTMNAVIGRLGREQQVIILTCAPERYAFIADAQRYSMEELKEAGRRSA
ncbi:hypothetical protein C1Y63_01810 [Corynebacterium sp. 13CS0277]|uniref:AAA family ATPase n=1 Tax=Corynebacterium sp. 13CS0277 TaxID=2071994 RepID=UPI000D0268DE|nr:AAA family ATPase [Corynebacterium sp. 13CS0277]PRQ12313.1 hypothetical protein C1Y63_01810 [Corynebacterium sp. 13CS0277]